jgi:NAD(P)-dependent dehydrogenase (short-subunit alcohol dehydrogenase family)
MDIQGRTILVLGGAGLVGKAVCRRLLAEHPAHLIVGDVRQERAESVAEQLESEAPEGSRISSCSGNIFFRWDERHLSWDELLSDPESRRELLKDTLAPMVGELRQKILAENTLTCFVREYQPDAVVDCINTATAFAYQNLYQSAGELLASVDADREGFREAVERHLVKMYTPQLVRHMQILYETLTARPGENWPGVAAYVKVGTSGTGGMGLNIPYTHGEERPSSVLLSKTAVAGAHSLLLFLLARTPPARPAIKEIKPTAAIAWAEISHGPVKLRGQPVPLYDCPPDRAYPLDEALASEGDFGESLPGKVLENVYVDAGENGLFSLGEFSVLTALDQMEFVTPEDVAEAVVLELEGGNTGYDVISALDQAVLGPTYRAGLLRAGALARMHQLEKEHGATSVAFESLGPPRVAKLLFEASLLHRVSQDSMSGVCSMSPENLAAACYDQLVQKPSLRAEMISIGIPVLTPDGDHLLRGPLIKADNAEDGWVDLTAANFRRWQDRLRQIREMAQTELETDKGLACSRFNHTFLDMATQEVRDAFDPGEVVAWIFIHEEKGARMKS